MTMKTLSQSTTDTGAHVTIAILSVGGAAAIAAGWVAANTGVKVNSAVLIAALVALGGVIAALIARTAIRKQKAILDNQNRLAQSVAQAGVTILMEGVDGAAISVNGATSVGDMDSLERFLAAPDDPVLADCRARVKAGAGVDVMWAAESDPTRRYEVSARPEPDGGVLWILRDARGSLAGQLSEDVDDFCATLDFGTDGLFVLDGSGRFVFANKSLASWLGTSPMALMAGEGVTLADAIGVPVDSAAFGAHTTMLPLRNQADQIFVKGQWMHGAGSGATSVAKPVFCGVATKLSGGGMDNTVLFDQAPIAITVLDRSRCIVQSNHAFQMLVDHENTRSQNLAEIVVEDQQAAVSVHLTAAMAGSVGPIEARLAGDAGLVVLMYAASVQMGDDDAGLIVYLIDSTRQKILEQQIAQSQKMQAVGQLAGGIAHDFNNLLTAMIGFCDLLLQRHRAGDQSFADIMQIKQNANRAARLVRQLLAFSRQQVLEPRPLDVTDALADLNNLLQRLLGEQVEMRMEHGRDLGMVKVDQGQFDQVIINLAVNARDAMPKGGTLTIRTARRELAHPVPAQGEDMVAGAYIVITVQDTGIGIESANLERIFDPFFTTKDVGAGTGLGLSTVYGIIKQTGGHIVVESAGEGQGAVFTIYLKRLDVQAGAMDADEAPARDVTGGGKVLLVEDEDPVRLFSARALRSKGYKVVEARNGEAALEILNAESFDLLITDMIMPKVNGATVIKTARETSHELPVICISGYTDESVLSEIESLDRVLFLPKPFSLKQLAGKVKEALEI
jgi:two-component system, cell cycle sensor histidine kinase and response regulator CckA